MPKISDTAYELYLFIKNDSQLYRQQFLPIIKNLVKKSRKGIYDVAKAQKLWGYLAGSGAQAYTKEMNETRLHGSFGIFSPADRREVAAHFEDVNRADIIREAKKPGSVWTNL